MANFKGFNLALSPSKETINTAKKLIDYEGECSSVGKYIRCSTCFAKLNDGSCIFHKDSEEKRKVGYLIFKIELAKEYINKFSFFQEEMEL